MFNAQTPSESIGLWNIVGNSKNDSYVKTRCTSSTDDRGRSISAARQVRIAHIIDDLQLAVVWSKDSHELVRRSLYALEPSFRYPVSNDEHCSVGDALNVVLEIEILRKQTLEVRFDSASSFDDRMVVREQFRVLSVERADGAKIAVVRTQVELLHVGGGKC